MALGVVARLKWVVHRVMKNISLVFCETIVLII